MLPTTTYLFWIIFGIPREINLYSLRVQNEIWNSRNRIIKSNASTNFLAIFANIWLKFITNEYTNKKYSLYIIKWVQFKIKSE